MSTLFGRKIHIPDIDSQNAAAQHKAQNLAINAPIQGTGADLVRRAMIRVPHELEEQGLSAQMLMTIHDELVFEVPENEADKVIKIVKQIMETAGAPDVDFKVPIIVEAKAAKTWGDAH